MYVYIVLWKVGEVYNLHSKYGIILTVAHKIMDRKRELTLQDLDVEGRIVRRICQAHFVATSKSRIVRLLEHFPVKAV